MFHVIFLYNTTIEFWDKAAYQSPLINFAKVETSYIGIDHPINFTQLQGVMCNISKFKHLCVLEANITRLFLVVSPY